MRPETKQRILLGSVCLLLCTVVGVLSAVITRVSITRNKHGEPQAVTQGTPQPVPSAPAQALPSAPSAYEEPSPKAAAENPQELESIYMVLGHEILVTAMSGIGMALPYEGVGPCRQLRQVSNISLDLSAAATGCRSVQCLLNLRVTMPLNSSCANIPAPYPTVYWISGFTCQSQYYSTMVNRIASHGYAVVQYDRKEGIFQPSSEQETLYYEQIMAWRNWANLTWKESPGSFAGMFAPGPIAVVGHSMGGGLTAIQAGLHQQEVGAAVLLDPIDFTSQSLRVARRFLADYHQPVMVVTVGVHCIDRRRCLPPQDHLPTAAEEAAWRAAGFCEPSWTCCHWDDGKTGLESKTRVGMTQATDGPSGFVEFAKPGSWLARLPQAGHMSFVDPGPGQVFFGGTTICPAAGDSTSILPDASALVISYLEYKLQGQEAVESLTLAWAAAKPEQQLTLAIKGALGHIVSSPGKCWGRVGPIARNAKQVGR